MVAKNASKKTAVHYVKVADEFGGQRLDNYLLRHLKGIPKSHIYRLIRKGEIRINKGRTHPFYRLMQGDSIRIPPVALAHRKKITAPKETLLQWLGSRILYEDQNLIVLNKPSGMSVHGGSTVDLGIIEAFRFLYPKNPHLELAHRLDSETSGCLILAKKRKILKEIHAELRQGNVKKIYWALTKGQWPKPTMTVNLPLLKSYEDNLKHVVKVSSKGKAAQTIFRTLKKFAQASFMEIELKTGRTHQIRVHAMHQHHPIGCDDRYGDREFNKLMKEHGLKRLFLHARSLDFTLPSLDQHIKVIAPLDQELEAVLQGLEKNNLNLRVNHELRRK